MPDLTFIVVGFRHGDDRLLRVLLAVDDTRSGEQLFDGDPIVMVTHRRGAPASALVFDFADAAQAIAEHVTAAAAPIRDALDAVFDDDDAVRDHMLLGIRIES